MKENSIEYYLSLGSNQGDRATNLQKGFHFLKEFGLISQVSSIYETEPVGMGEDVADFYNLVLCLITPDSLLPLELLRRIKEFEKKMGRDIHHSHNRPRVIDIDILLMGDQIIESSDLVIPHKEMSKRAFVLIPLVEIAADLKHPVLNQSVNDILASLSPEELSYKVTKLPGPNLLPWISDHLLNG